MSKDIGITVKKELDFSEWYTQVVLKAELLDYAPAKGFIILRPYGYTIWENIKNVADQRFKETEHNNAFLPVLIPESLLTKEAEHFQGFQPEVFWVTHAGNNKLVEKLAVRPTSETLAYEVFAKWVRSYRDLPLKLNFWNSALRAEIKATKPLIRNSEFLWQEGHTVHASKEEAEEEVITILKIYKEILEEYLAIPVIEGYKSNKEKFVGAEYTLTLEAMMPDGKALQMGTSHNLGQNFSKVFDIKYLDKNNREVYAWQASWGISWRLIGAMIMVHGDDQGLIIPPKIAPIQVVIIPIYYKKRDREAVIEKAKKVREMLNVRSKLDDREEYTPGYKFHDWELKGVPLRIEIGPRDVKDAKVVIARRDLKEKYQVKDEDIVANVNELLAEIQIDLYNRARVFLEDNIHTADNYQDMSRLLTKGFVKAAWCGKEECEIKIKDETGADIRVIPFDASTDDNCIYCNNKGRYIAYFARAY
jgi:prolyl-tRNA synthetase